MKKRNNKGRKKWRNKKNKGESTKWRNEKRNKRGSKKMMKWKRETRKEVKPHQEDLEKNNWEY